MISALQDWAPFWQIRHVILCISMFTPTFSLSGMGSMGRSIINYTSNQRGHNLPSHVVTKATLYWDRSVHPWYIMFTEVMRSVSCLRRVLIRQHAIAYTRFLGFVWCIDIDMYGQVSKSENFCDSHMLKIIRFIQTSTHLPSNFEIKIIEHSSL